MKHYSHLSQFRFVDNNALVLHVDTCRLPLTHLGCRSAIFYLPLSKPYTLSLLINRESSAAWRGTALILPSLYETVNARESWNFPESVMWDTDQFGSRPAPGDGIIAGHTSICPPVSNVIQHCSSIWIDELFSASNPIARPFES